MVSLAVIIVSWNVASLLDRCLSTLREELARGAVAAEVWVVDNASGDGSAALVRERHPWVRLEAQTANLGFVRGNNLVLEQLARAGWPDFIWLLNPDTELRPGALAALLDCMARHPRAGLCGPRLLNPDGTLQQSAFRFPGLWQPLFDLGWLPLRFYETPLNGRYRRVHYESGRPFRVDHPLGAALLARGTAVAQVGWLDPDFFMYCEEIDWAWRMRRAGWEAWLAPAATVVHYGGVSTGQARPAATAHLWISRARLYRKYHGSLTRALVGWGVRRAFARRQAPSPEWALAYRQIVEAWQ